MYGYATDETKLMPLTIQLAHQLTGESKYHLHSTVSVTTVDTMTKY